MTIDAVTGVAEMAFLISFARRGFIFASIIAYKLGIGMIPVRKPGKLPGIDLKKDSNARAAIPSAKIRCTKERQSRNSAKIAKPAQKQAAL